MDDRLLKREIFQSAWVVDDVESASYFWTQTFGVGPFLLFDFVDAFSDVLYRGEPGEFRVLLALAQSGQTQIELIQPMSHPSVYRDSVDFGKTGFHHVCAWTSDFEADLMDFESIGCPAAFSAKSGETQFAYFDTRDMIGCMFEIVTRNEEVEELFRRVEEASINWDGSDPVRKGN